MQQNVRTDAILEPSECRDCVTRELTLYGHLDAVEQARFAGCRLRSQDVKPRRGIYWADRPSDEIAVLKQGWAFSFKLLSDGRRQILDFYMDGDILGLPLVLNGALPFGVQSITNCRLCLFRADQLRDLAIGNPCVELLFWRNCVNERFESMDRLVDLGRRTAMERLCRMLLRLMERAVARGKGKPADFEFPLRHHHIADYLGLTSVHTGRLLTTLVQHDVLRLEKRRLSLLDDHRLRQMAGEP